MGVPTFKLLFNQLSARASVLVASVLIIHQGQIISFFFWPIWGTTGGLLY